MTKTYTIPMDCLEKVLKQIARIQRKAEKYGSTLEYEIGSPYTKERSYFVTNPDHTHSEIDKELVEVIDVSIIGEEVKKGDYQVISAIEHGDKGNIVHTFTGIYRNEWSRIEGKCDHCHTNHRRVHTFIVRGADGEHQVGRSCLKDYCGIDPHSVGYSNELNDIFLEEEKWQSYFATAPAVYDTIHILAHAQRIVKEQGYVKSDYASSNKNVLIDRSWKPVTEEEHESAKALAEGLMGMDGIDGMLANIQTSIRCGYCKRSAFGYLAYAPVMYLKHIEKLAREEEKNRRNAEEAKLSEYVGTVGERMIVDIKQMDLVTSFPTDFGMTHLYKMIDSSDNVLIWFTSSASNGFSRAKVTIKDHNIRDGVKQTIVTRCKAC